MLSTTSPIGVAFFGAGDISNLHAAAIRRIPTAVLVGIWSLPGCSVVTDPAAVASRYGCKLYATPEDLVNDPTVAVVFVLTSLESHCQLAVLAMDHKKHVLVEKPVASSKQELRTMKAASERNGVVFMPGGSHVCLLGFL